MKAFEKIGTFCEEHSIAMAIGNVAIGIVNLMCAYGERNLGNKLALTASGITSLGIGAFVLEDAYNQK